MDLQAVHRVRERWVMRRTAVINQIRGLLLERVVTLSKGRSHLEQALPQILEDANLKLSDSFRVSVKKFVIPVIYDPLPTFRARLRLLVSSTCHRFEISSRWSAETRFAQDDTTTV